MRFLTLCSRILRATAFSTNTLAFSSCHCERVIWALIYGFADDADVVVVEDEECGMVNAFEVVVGRKRSLRQTKISEGKDNKLAR